VSSAAPSRAAPTPGSTTAALTLAHGWPLPIAASMTPASTATMATCIDRRSAGVGVWTSAAAPSGVGLPSRSGGPGTAGRGSGLSGGPWTAG
jgi:hypothetical protein